MQKILIYTTSNCTHCNNAKSLLQKNNLAYDEISLDDKQDLREKLSAENSGWRTVPMIFSDDKFIGGYTELLEHLKQ